MIMAARATGKEPCRDDSLCSKENRELLRSAVCRRHPSCGHVCQRTWLYTCMLSDLALGTTMSASRIAARPGSGEDLLCTAAATHSDFFAEGPTRQAHD